MTDHVKQIVQQIVAAAGDPLATLESVGGRMGHLYQQAEQAGDAGAMQVISYAWTEIQQMNEQTNTAAGLAAAAQEVADKITQQRDAVVKQHTDLVSDLNNVNLDNQLVQRAFEAGEQSEQENLMYSGAYISDDPADDIVHGINAIPCPYDTAGRFFEMLTGGWEISSEQASKLADFMMQFVSGVLAEEAAEEIDVNDIDDLNGAA